MNPAQAMERVAEIEEELAMFERMKAMAGPPHNVRIHLAGHEHIADLEAERAELVKAYGN